MRAALLLLTVSLLAATALTACGGKDDSGSSSPAASPARAAGSGPSTEDGGDKGQGSGGSGGSGPNESGSGDGDGGGSGVAGGGAQSFVRPGADNSIPTFGEEAGSSEFDEAEAALRSYLGAREAGDWRTVCSLLSDEAVEKLSLITKATGGKVRGCVEVVEALAGKAAPATRRNLLAGRNLAALRVEKNTVFALFHGPQGIDYVIPMVKDEGAWKVVQLTPVPYPIGSKPPTP